MQTGARTEQVVEQARLGQVLEQAAGGGIDVEGHAGEDAVILHHQRRDGEVPVAGVGTGTSYA